MGQYSFPSVKEVLINKYNYTTMISNANLVFLNDELKEYDKADGTKQLKHYGYFSQDNATEVIKINLLPESKYEKYKSYSIKIETKFYNFTSATGEVKNILVFNQVK